MLNKCAITALRLWTICRLASTNLWGVSMVVLQFPYLHMDDVRSGSQVLDSVPTGLKGIAVSKGTELQLKCFQASSIHTCGPSPLSWMTWKRTNEWSKSFRIVEVWSSLNPAKSESTWQAYGVPETFEHVPFDKVLVCSLGEHCKEPPEQFGASFNIATRAQTERKIWAKSRLDPRGWDDMIPQVERSTFRFQWVVRRVQS